MTEIEQALSRLFGRHRIVVWHDTQQDMGGEYEAVSLPDVVKITVANNEFSVKYRILRQEPQQKFLLYIDGAPPDDPHNWLLDVQLAHGVFRADKISLWLSELGLGPEFTDTTAPHSEFFEAASRRSRLKARLRSDDTARQIKLKMLAVCAGSDSRLENIVEQLLVELADRKTAAWDLITRCALDAFLWQQMARTYDYVTDNPSIHDFAIELFKSSYAMQLGEKARLNNDAFVFLQRWKANMHHQGAFAHLSAESADVLQIRADLEGRPYRQLVNLDMFELIDQKILHSLVQDVTRHTISVADCEQIVRDRRPTPWYETYAHLYEAVLCAASFLHRLDEVDLHVDSFTQGIEQYTAVWYELDQLYRQFVSHMLQAHQPQLLGDLTDLVENSYTNSYLLKLSDAWQQVVDTLPRWDVPDAWQQRRLYRREVAPVLAKDKKLCVIISDALRYEAGAELLSLIRQEDRFDADLETAVTLLPSYTQLGMAALLPNTELSISDKNSNPVLVDGQSSQGSENRQKVLAQGAAPKAAQVLRSEELLEMGRDESRALFRDHDVVYVYHNRIDATGDKRGTEGDVFPATDAALVELIVIIKKLANANASNMLVTADHGFIYQHRELDESEYASEAPQGAEIVKVDRRFVLGRGLLPTASFKHFHSADVGLVGDLEMLIPKSINRLRKQGAGSRYVHGGATLQEIVVPVLHINKKRQSDVTTVAVSILGASPSIISAGQKAIQFYQEEPVTDKVQKRVLVAGIYGQDGVLISDKHELVFDMTAEDPRQREMEVRFVLASKSDDYNNQEVVLKLEERVGDTSHFKQYATRTYQLRRSFTSDFDF